MPLLSYYSPATKNAHLPDGKKTILAFVSEQLYRIVRTLCMKESQWPPHRIIFLGFMPFVQHEQKEDTLTVERTRLACFSCHSERSCLTFETVSESYKRVSSAHCKSIQLSFQIQERLDINKKHQVTFFWYPKK